LGQAGHWRGRDYHSPRPRGLQIRAGAKRAIRTRQNRNTQGIIGVKYLKSGIERVRRRSINGVTGMGPIDLDMIDTAMRCCFDCIRHVYIPYVSLSQRHGLPLTCASTIHPP
jgi:hypothetical protein